MPKSPVIVTVWPEGEYPPEMRLPLGLTMGEVQHRYALATWEANGRRMAKTARSLGVSTVTTRRYLRMYDPEQPKRVREAKA